MAKVFDLVHKVSEPADESPSQRIPFADEDLAENTPAPKRRARVEIIFFYLLLFAVFFIMGAVFLAPNLFTRLNAQTAKQTASPSPINTPNPGFVITKDGQSIQEAGKELNTPPTPTPSPVISPSPAATASSSTTAKSTTSIQILNGTTVEGAAAAMRTKLANAGIVVGSIGNYKKQTVAKTTVYYLADYKKAAQQVLAITGGIMVEASSATTGGKDVLIVLGRTK